MNASPILVYASVALSLAAVTSPTLAQRVSIGSQGQLPEIQCTATQCNLNYTVTQSPASAGVLAADPTPVVAAPPAGQRYYWHGAGYPACQSLVTMSPQPTISAPYDYIYANAVPVPLGSTHAALLASLQVNLGRGATGDAATVGMLQIRRSGGTWYNVSVSYAYTIRGSSPPSSLYNRATYDGLVDLASLPGGSTVPDLVDVRLGVFPFYTNTPASDVAWNSVCWGNLAVTF